ncbi:ubiquinone biosynthesis protein [Rhodococcus rhodnii LMG 5362]|uniref:Ubiquinone biosynthesis protein n=1 Tax=Rhodococcus rhodnii LMG 5362 TaxID=1273125 RepID=R7WSM7_9NOCA|nr:ubiquinone biosynthesis protein [Rhodococcus rhodnii LMG 5362]
MGPYAGGPPAAALVVPPHELERFRGREIARAGVIAVVIVWRVVLALLAWIVAPRGRRIADAASDGVVDAFEILGPTFVKVGQLIASSSGVFPAPLANAALRCLDDVPPVDTRQARAVVEADLGHPIDALFASFDDVPLAAASVAQVHACTLHDGREVVLKVQRPGIFGRMLVDLRTAFWGARLLERFEFFRVANATAIIRDLHAATMTELNSAVEAARQETIRDNLWQFGDNKGVTAPEVLWDYCGPHVICMERMTGIPLDRFDEIAHHDTRMLIRRGVKVWIESVLLHGPFHGDVHAGNLWVLGDGRLAMLDFGIVGELPPQWRTILREMFHATLFDGDFRKMAAGIRALGYTADVEASDEKIGLDVAAALTPVLTQDLGELRLSDLIMALIAIGKQWGVASPEELVLFGKQLGYFERYATQLAPGWVLGQDLFLFRNVFPDDVAARVAQTGLELPE